MNPSRSPEKGEVLKLGPPASGEVILTVDPRAGGTTFAAGTETLLPGAHIPVHKHLDQDEVLFVHKGQGRAIVNERGMVVLPGAMLYVPRGVWHGLRNTGTGVLQIAWVSAPAGLEDFFRDLSRLGASPSAQAIQELTQRHRIEFRPAADAPMPKGRRHRGRHGGHRHGGGRGPARPAASQSAMTPSSAPVGPSSTASDAQGAGPKPSTVPPAPAAPSAPRGRRRHRRRHSGGAGSQALPPAAAQQRREPRTTPSQPGLPVVRGEATGALPSASAPASRPGSSRPSPAGQRSPQRHRRRRIREVYMGGRWIQVEGEGPVIASESQRPQRRHPNRGEDDEPPPARLSVTL